MTLTKNQSGFTMIEIMIVLAILGVLMGVLIPVTVNYYRSTFYTVTDLKLKKLHTAVDMFRLGIGQYPARLESLIRRPSDAKAASKWRGPYGGISQLEDLEDGWGEVFVYKITSGGTNPYELYSHGPDGQGSDGRISAWVR